MSDKDKDKNVVEQSRLECGTMRHPAKREPSGGDSRVSLELVSATRPCR
mgnify:CR=1 FL=1